MDSSQAFDTSSSLPVLILIHGATWNGHMWDVVRAQLDPRYQVLAPDLPGHGTRRGETYTLAGAVDTIVAAARSVAPAPVLLVGDSLGGYTALAAAAALPAAQLRGLVVGGCSANLHGAVLFPLIVKSAMFKLLTGLFGEERIVRSTMPKALAKMGLGEADIGPSIAAGISLRAFGDAVRALRNVDFRAKLAAIIQPVLIVNGSLDKPMVRQEPAFLAVAQHGSQHRFPDCPHGVSVLRNKEFAWLVEEFARHVAPKPSARFK